MGQTIRITYNPKRKRRVLPVGPIPTWPINYGPSGRQTKTFSGETTMSMSETLNNIHCKAMSLVDLANEYKNQCKRVLLKAFELEKIAAMCCLPGLDKAILCKSAATIAVELNMIVEARELINLGLECKLPTEIIRELEEVLAQTEATQPYEQKS
jgi:hypothetical protein